MRKITAILLAAPMALLSFSALAQTVQPEIEILSLEAPEGDVDAGNPRPWVNIGADPFRGDVAQGANVLAAKTDYNPSDFLEGARMRSLGQCIRYDLKDDDVLRTTYAQAGSMLARVAFAQGKPRGADVCIVQRHANATKARAVVFPDGCTNVSAATVSLKLTVVQLPIVENTVRPRPRGRAATMTMSPGAPQMGGQHFGVGVMLFDGGGHTTNVHNNSASNSVSASVSASVSESVSASVSASTAGSVSTSGALIKSVPAKINSGNGGHHGQ